MILPLICQASPTLNVGRIIHELKQNFKDDLLLIEQQGHIALWPSAAASAAVADRMRQPDLAPLISSLPQAIIEAALQQQVKLGTAESCTGGLAASLLTDVAGSSAVMQGGIVSYSNEVKMNILKVEATTLAQHGAVSTPVAQAMAAGAALALKADLVVSYSGIAGPGGGSAQKPVGTVAIGTFWRGKATAQLYHFTGDRLSLKKQFAMQGLMKVWEILQQKA